MREVVVYPDMLTLTHAAAERIAQAAEAALVARGRFTIALSGGNTPRALYQLLASEEYQGRIDWENTYFFWGDERCVPPDDQQSDYHMAREAMLNHVPVPMSHIFRIRGEIDPQQAANDYERLLRDFFVSRAVGNEPQPRFDVQLLGMGENAHTASLFPHTPAIDERERWVVAQYVEEVAMWRVTLTPPALNASALILFLVAGAGKAEPLAQVLGQEQRPQDLPAQVVHPVDGELVWLVDREAAKLL